MKELITFREIKNILTDRIKIRKKQHLAGLKGQKDFKITKNLKARLSECNQIIQIINDL